MKILILLMVSTIFAQKPKVILTQKWIRGNIPKKQDEVQKNLRKLNSILLQNNNSENKVLLNTLKEQIQREGRKLKEYKLALEKVESFNSQVFQLYINQHYANPEARASMKTNIEMDNNWNLYKLWIKLEKEKEEEREIRESTIFEPYKKKCIDNLSKKFSKPIYQKNSWSCVPQAITAVTEYHINKKRGDPIHLSPYYSYALIQESRMTEGCNGTFKFSGFHIFDFVEPLKVLEEQGICSKDYFDLFNSDLNIKLKGKEEYKSAPVFPEYYQVNLSKVGEMVYYKPQYDSGSSNAKAYEKNKQDLLKDLVNLLEQGNPPVLGIRSENRETLPGGFSNYIPGSMNHAVALMGFCYPEGSDEPYFTVWDSKNKNNEFTKVKASDLLHNLLQVHVISGAKEEIHSSN